MTQKELEEIKELIRAEHENSKAEDKKNGRMFSVKDIVSWSIIFAGLVTTFTVTQMKVENNRQDIDEMQKYNLELLNYKLEEIAKKQDVYINAFNEFLDDYYTR